MANARLVRDVTILLTLLMIPACGGGTQPMAPSPSPSPVPPGDAPTANVYILPGAVDLGPNAFGDEAIVIHRGERMHWLNADTVEHNLLTDTRSLPEFVATPLAPGGERSFIMNTVGSTTFHCTIHPQMTGRVVVQN